MIETLGASGLCRPSTRRSRLRLQHAQLHLYLGNGFENGSREKREVVVADVQRRQYGKDVAERAQPNAFVEQPFAYFSADPFVPSEGFLGFAVLYQVDCCHHPKLPYVPNDFKFVQWG